MLYQAYQLQEDLVASMRFFAQSMRASAATAAWGVNDSFRGRFTAALEMISRFRLTHTRPDFAIPFVRSATAMCR